MTPERWQEIERLYHSARESGLGVLAGTDPDVRREVERLLAQDSAGQILDEDAGALLAEMTLEAGDGEEAAPDLVGRTIAQYEVRERIGAGGMGVVYKAFDTKLKRWVALKFLPHASRLDADWKRRLMEEARAASALDHPNIVVIYEVGEMGDDLFLAMAYHEGTTLRQKMGGRMEVDESLRIAKQVAMGLARAHEQGIVHRDIKPGNVMVAKDGVVRIIDFGLAKAVSGEVPEEEMRGTPLYMSPEQVLGKAVDARTDVWSLGVVLFEMLAGKAPFGGKSRAELLRAVVSDNPAPLLDVPAEVARIVERAIEKDPARRYSSAAQMADDIEAALEAPRIRGRWLRAAVLFVLLLVAVGTGWLYWRAQRQLWAREKAIPEIGRLREQQKMLGAYRLLQEAEKALPGDGHLRELREGLTHEASVRSVPSGGFVEIKDYASPGDGWLRLGMTPLEKARIPSGYLRWRVSKDAAVYEGAPVAGDMFGPLREFEFRLDLKAPDGMVAVPAAKYEDYIFSLGALGPYDLPAYYMDRFEVTNREYQKFVDGGGYAKPGYWKNRFVRDGRELNWQEAMVLLRDSTGRPGPSTWKHGQYPEGHAEYPVGGVSWYEAAAYAEFVGKSLPAISQWFRAAPSSVAKHIVTMSNFSNGPAPVGQYQGIGPWGTYDMAGNVAEWCWNEGGSGAKFLLGGGFGTATAEYLEPSTIPPFHRGANAGFRCVRNVSALPKDVLAERRPMLQDFSKAQPVSEETFRIYKTLYAYDRTPLREKVESLKAESDAWRKERVMLDAAYGRERFRVYLFLPARGRPPFQTVIYFPTARALNADTGESLVDMHLIDFVIRSGRAVAYPIYKGTYDRAAAPPGTDSVAARDTLIQDSKDLGRTIDYLETRSDVDARRVAFMGTSMGAAVGVILAGVEQRLRTVIFLDGGFFQEKQLPGAAQADFAPRIKAPTLLIGGKFDWIFYGKEALLGLIGTPAADKKAILFDTAHDVSEQRADLTREVLAWLDRYLGSADR